MNIGGLGSAVSILGLVSVGVIACSSANPRSGLNSDETTAHPADAGSGPSFVTGGGSGKGSPCAINNIGADPDADSDGDGYPLKHDCNECDPNVNNGAFDVPGNGIDEDCNGTRGDEPVDCDDGLSMGSSDAFAGP